MNKLKKISKNKNASIQVSISWIFMIIIGTFFLILGYNIIAKYKMIENQKYEIELKNTLRNVFNNVGRTAGIEENKLNSDLGNLFRNLKVEVECIDGIPLLSLNGKPYSNNEFIQTYPIFMTTIEEAQVSGGTYLAVESFRMPFKITNMLALISRRNFIIFDQNSEISKKLIYKFQKSSYSQLNFIIKDFSTIDNEFVYDINKKKFNSITLVSDKDIGIGESPSPINLNEFKADYVYKLEVDYNKEKRIGNLTYFDINNKKYSFNFIDFDKSQSLVSMAIFSKPETFNCSYNLILNSIPPNYSFYINKTNYLINLTGTKKLCSSTLSTEEERIKYREIAKSLNTTKNIIIQEGFNNLTKLSNSLALIDRDEKGLEKFSCIYTY